MKIINIIELIILLYAINLNFKINGLLSNVYQELLFIITGSYFYLVYPDTLVTPILISIYFCSFFYKIHKKLYVLLYVTPLFFYFTQAYELVNYSNFYSPLFTYSLCSVLLVIIFINLKNQEHRQLNIFFPAVGCCRPANPKNG